MSALGETLRALAEVLDERRLRWFVFGAQAIAVRGAPRATQDVDVTVEIAEGDVATLLEALARVGIRHRYPHQAEEILARGAVLPLKHPSGMEVDLVLAGAGLEMLALDRAARVDVDGVAVPVAHATDLVVMKILAGRGKDLDDVRAVLASGEVDIAEARSLLTQLEEALGRSDLVRAFDDAVHDVNGP
jgi:hypothetical protein